MPHVYVIVSGIYLLTYLSSLGPRGLLRPERHLRQIIFVPHEQQIGRNLHKDLSLDEKTMPHAYVIVSRI